ncbi:MAG: hypothetical protein GYA24_01395 [Candidatus Lokiarchaeota archaeon]|nr:hypothetical protein [Candidatus Lokiarchaeota archaeon]
MQRGGLDAVTIVPVPMPGFLATGNEERIANWSAFVPVFSLVFTRGVSPSVFNTLSMGIFV